MSLVAARGHRWLAVTSDHATGVQRSCMTLARCCSLVVARVILIPAPALLLRRLAQKSLISTVQPQPGPTPARCSLAVVNCLMLPCCRMAKCWPLVEAEV